MGGGFLPDNKKFALAANYGTFAGQNALAVTGLVRATDAVVFTGSVSVGIGTQSNDVGGRVGMQIAW
jgi:hypothetical protein